jgi:hypothetical protein
MPADDTGRLALKSRIIRELEAEVARLQAELRELKK